MTPEPRRDTGASQHDRISYRWTDRGLPDDALIVARDLGQDHAVDKQMAALARRLGELLSLEDGWDTYGGRAPQGHLLNAGLRFVEPLLTADLESPHVTPTSRGGVQFEWHVGDAELEIEVVGSDRFEIFFEDEKTGEVVERQVTSRHLGQVVELLNRLRLRR